MVVNDSVNSRIGLSGSYRSGEISQAHRRRFGRVVGGTGRHAPEKNYTFPLKFEIGSSRFTLGGPAPPDDPIGGKILTYA